MMRAFFHLLAVFWCLAGVSFRNAEAQAPLGGSLNFLLTDTALWKLPAAELPARLEPSGYTNNASTGLITLGEPKDMMQRKASLFTDDLSVWKATLTQGTTLRSVTLDFMPPPALAKTPDKQQFRNIARRIEERLTEVMKAKPSIHPPDYLLPDAAVKLTSQRWVNASLQAVLITSALETRTTFTPQRLELRIMPAIAPGKTSITKAPVARVDKASGNTVLEGFPAEPAWEGSHRDWLVLEQALHATGRASDRNGILEHYQGGASWAATIALGVQRISALSGARTEDVVPLVHLASEIVKLTKACDSAAKKAGKHSPQQIGNLTDVDAGVLLAARTGGNDLPAFLNAVKQAIGAGRPVFWYGWRGIYAETPAAGGAATPVVRLIIGYTPRSGEVIFAGADGKPGTRMKAAEALAASLYVTVISPK